MNILKHALNEMKIQMRSRSFGLLYDYKQYDRIVKLLKSPAKYD